MGWFKKIAAFFIDENGDHYGVKQTSNTPHVRISDGTNNVNVNSDGQLHVVQTSKADDNNSTSTPLLADAVFTGASTDLQDFSGISVVVNTDVASASKGLSIQQSEDGNHWHELEAYTVPANADKPYTPPVFMRYLRIVYTNGGSDQSDFHLQTRLHKNPIKWSSHNLNDNLRDDDDGTLNVTVLKLRTAQDDYVSAASTSSGNFKVSLEELESGVSENSNTSLRTTLVDGNNNIIHASSDADGDYHLATSLIQEIISSSNNSTTDNLASAATFTGTADTTYGINGIQVYHYADQDCTIYIDQSLDGTNWDITDSFECLANNACTRTFTSVAPYYRARVTNNGDSTTTVMRFATGMTPIVNPLPRALTDDDRLKVEGTLTGRENSERHVWVSPTNALKVENDVRLVGTNFDGTTKDTNFWTETTTGSGTVTQSGEIQLDTGTTANSTAQYDSVRKARFIVGSALKWQGMVKFVTAGTTDNVRRVGAYDDDNGFYFELDGTTFSVGYRNATVDTLVSSGSFNGNYGPNYTMDTSYHKLEIEWTPRGVFFYIDGTLLHKDNQGHRSNVLSLPIRIENVNDNGNTTDVSFDVIATAIVRLGNLITNPTSVYQSGTTAGLVLKYGAGTLRGAVISGVVNNSVITLYDNTAASGRIIWSSGTMGAQTQPYELDFHSLPFSTGLTLVISGANSNITIIYE